MPKTKDVLKSREAVPYRRGRNSPEKAGKVAPHRETGLSAAELRRIVIEIVG